MSCLLRTFKGLQQLVLRRYWVVLQVAALSPELVLGQVWVSLGQLCFL